MYPYAHAQLNLKTRFSRARLQQFGLTADPQKPLSPKSGQHGYPRCFDKHRGKSIINHMAALHPHLLLVLTNTYNYPSATLPTSGTWHMVA